MNVSDLPPNQMNTIEREIEHISDRLNDQKEVENSTARMHGVSSHADLAGGASLEASRQGMTAKRLGIPSGTTGKRSRVRGAEVSTVVFRGFLFVATSSTVSSPG